MKPIQTIPSVRAVSTAEQLAAALEEAVTRGELSGDQRLPSIRGLADATGLANGTVARAYRRLRDRGVVVTEGRRGTRIRARSVLVPRQGIGLDLPDHAIDLSDGNPDLDLLPDLAPHLASAAAAAGVYGEDPLPWLHEGLARVLRERATVAGVPTDHLVLVSGALDGIERALAAHLRPGDVVAVEDPGWPNLLDLVAAMGIAAVPVAVDDEGPTVDGLAAVVDRIDAFVVTSRAQNPTGAVLTPRRREHLAGLLEGRDLVVLEDDHGGEVSGVDLAPLADVTSRWLLVQSLSKSWGPDLRVAAAFGDEVTVSRIAGRLRLGPGWVSRILQHVAWSLLTDAAARDTVATAATTMARRRRWLHEALADRGVAARGRSGLNVWVPVPDETTVVAGLVARGWGVAPGARYRLESAPGIRITAAAVPTMELAEAFATDLAAVVHTPGRAAV